MKNILILINDGFEEVETITPYDLLKRAGANVILGSFKCDVTGAHNLIIKSDIVVNESNYKDFDLIILPGGPEYKFNKENQLYKDIISYYVSNKAIASICATPTILGEMRLLNNQKYTCFTPMNRNFNGIFTNNPSEISNNIITGRSAGTALDFSFSIIKYLFGEKKLEEIKKDILY